MRGDRGLEIWAGVECTVNRVGDAFLDQLERTGHAARDGDLAAFAELGVTAIRYPVPWERVAPAGPDSADWSWPDARLRRLRELGVDAIVGLVHHGSGPRYTSLLDPEFGPLLARYAEAVAARYPWVTRFTPINEPLTTARFSALYGYWAPHARDARAFAHAFLNQCRAVAAAMRAIRRVTPGAQLVQTEDLGKAYATPALRYQADFENERRWLTWDVLSGRFDRHHPLWGYFRWAGVSADDLSAAADEARCPPDVIGVNYYLTSERALSDHVAAYPPHTRGGNGRHEYADVEAVRARATGIAGPRALLAEVWDRYRLPLAVTEAHLGCTREQQLRWLAEVWDAAREMRARGADVRAVTAWALLGAFDWASCTRTAEGRYESGIFDIRAPVPRPTALARMVRDLATRGAHRHPALAGPGWWRCPQRLTFPPVDGGRAHAPAEHSSAAAATCLAVVGAGGTLGSAFARACGERHLACRPLTRDELDVTDRADVETTLASLRPWAVVNAAGYVRVDDAQSDAAACRAVNADGAAHLAAACERLGIRLVTFSSDLVFGGERRRPYVESDAPAPRGAYGASKAEAERRVLSALPSALVVRTSAFFGPWDDANFVTRVLHDLLAGLPVSAADDVVVSPTYVPDLVHATLDLLIDGAEGIWHLANAGETTWADLARAAARLAGADPGLVIGRPVRELAPRAPRPPYSALGSERAWVMPPLDDALDRYWHARPLVRGLEEQLMSVADAAAFGGGRDG